MPWRRIEERSQVVLIDAGAAAVSERIAARQREVQSWRARAEKHFNNPVPRFETAIGSVHVAALQEEAGQFAEALASLAEAVPSLEALAMDHPENLRWLQGLAPAWETLSRTHARAGRLPEAAAEAARAVALAEALARLDSAYDYDLACALSQRNMVAPSDADAAASFGALRRAMKAGPDTNRRPQFDHRLDGLRSHPDFPARLGVPE